MNQDIVTIALPYYMVHSKCKVPQGILGITPATAPQVGDLTLAPPKPDRSVI